MKAFVRKVFQAGSTPPPSTPLARRMGALTSIYYRAEYDNVVDARDMPPDPHLRAAPYEAPVAPAHAPPVGPPRPPRRNILIAPDSLPEKLRPLSFRTAVNILVQDRAPEADHVVRVALAACMRAVRDPGNRELPELILDLAERLGHPRDRFRTWLAGYSPTSRQATFADAYKEALGAPCQITKIATLSGYDLTRNVSYVQVSGQVNRPVKDFVTLFDPRSWAGNAPEAWTASYPVDELADQMVDRDLDPAAVERPADLTNNLFFEVAWWTMQGAVIATHRNLLHVDYNVVPDRIAPSKITFAFRQHGCLDGTFLGTPDEGGIDRDVGGATCEDIGGGLTSVTFSKSLRFTKPVELVAEVNQITAVVLGMWMELLLTSSLCEPASASKPAGSGPCTEHPCGCLGVCGCFPRPDMGQIRNDAVQRLRDMARCGEKIASSYQDLWRSQAALWCGLIPDPCAPAPKPGSYLLDSLAVSLSAWGQAYDGYHQFASACLGLPTKTKASAKPVTVAPKFVGFVVDTLAECTDPKPLEEVSAVHLADLSAQDPPGAQVLLASHVRFTMTSDSDQILVSLVDFGSLKPGLQVGVTYNVLILVAQTPVAVLELYVRT